MKKSVGVVGLGNMGTRMAKNLIKAHYPVTVYDIRPEPMDELKALGADVVETPKELGAKSDVVFVMVLNYSQVEACTLDSDHGLLYGMKPGSILVVTSTIAPSEIKKVAAVAALRKVNVLDSPVSGGVSGAEKGTLTMMVAGDDAVYESCKEIFATVGSNTRRVGKEIGLGQVVKAANQLLVSVHVVAMAEAMVLATKAGADPEVVFDVIKRSVGNSYLFEEKMPTILERNFSRRGALDIQIKDLDICLTMGREMNVPLLTSAISREVFLWANGMGLGSEDISAIIKVFEKAAGVEVRKRKEI
jgi:3-hydroxyisobutyrate dehydrogenase-like beta-hydroxyacid dehydrogenase